MSFPLPDEIITDILSHLAPEEAIQKALVSKQFYDAANDPKMWENFCRREGYEESDLPPGMESWKQLYASGMDMTFDPAHIGKHHRITNHGRTLIRDHKSAGGENQFQGAQLKKLIPMKGRFYFEVIPEWIAMEDGDQHTHGQRWFAIGIASHRWNPDGCGWWSSNDGSGWYAAGDIYSYDSKFGGHGNPEVINPGDRVGVLIDRERRKQYFFRNGKLQRPVITDDRFGTQEDMYPTFIILHAGKITVTPVRRPPAFIETSAEVESRPAHDDPFGADSGSGDEETDE